MVRAQVPLVAVGGGGGGGAGGRAGALQPGEHAGRAARRTRAHRLRLGQSVLNTTIFYFLSRQTDSKVAYESLLVRPALALLSLERGKEVKDRSYDFTEYYRGWG